LVLNGSGVVLMKANITLAITSCGRMDLLERTLKSFYKFNTYPISKTIIVDDSGGKFDSDRIAPLIPGDFQFLVNDFNIGQTRSIDRLYSQINTTYIFHCEDDWEFFAPGFIEDSLEILHSNPDIFTVWIRAHYDTNGHPLTKALPIKVGLHNRFLVKDYMNIWSGFTLNPGLRRLSDYLKLAPFSELEIVIPLKNKTVASEGDLSIHYARLGFRAVISNKVEGYVRHIGYASHIPLEWERGLFKTFLIKLKNLVKKILSSVR
jgi:hypothetical protein